MKRHRPPAIPLRQPGERPVETLTRTIAIRSACSGNGKPAATAPGINFGRARSRACQKRNGVIPAGSKIIIAAWTNRPLVTIHCTDCADRYLRNEADTPETRASSGDPQPRAEKKDVIRVIQKVAHHVPPDDTGRNK